MMNIRKAIEDPEYFIEKMLEFELTPYQSEQIHKILKSIKLTNKVEEEHPGPFAGTHSDGLLVIIDEASDIPKEIPEWKKQSNKQQDTFT